MAAARSVVVFKCSGRATVATSNIMLKCFRRNSHFDFKNFFVLFTSIQLI